MARVLELYWYREDRDHVEWLAGMLNKVYGVDVRLAGELGLPETYYDTVRQQWVSDKVLGFIQVLKAAKGASLVLAVVGDDAYSPGLNFVYGQAILGGGVAVVYTARLYPEFYGLEHDTILFRSRLLKEAMHELGHAFGLEHCSNKRCVMRFSNSILEVDSKEAKYCRRCASKLEAHGISVSHEYIIASRA